MAENDYPKSRITVTFLPKEQQDKLNKKLIKCSDGIYRNIERYDILIKDTMWCTTDGNQFQDLLTQDGLIKTTDGKYVPLDKVQDVRKYEFNCFIATEIYGDREAPQVETLREIRDQVLAKSAAGRAFTRFYYSGAGERTARVIGKHLPSTKPLIRMGLDTAVKAWNNSKEH